MMARAACADQVREILGEAYDTTERYGAMMELEDVVDRARHAAAWFRGDAGMESA